ncbi:unnamed protein product [Orchesella dallaii]|uniref:Uncharacterized protein n=1 Tax=Orchesella dallaii TaxID=48710 RepID=A0ABP1R4T0_9HEXA
MDVFEELLPYQNEDAEMVEVNVEEIGEEVMEENMEEPGNAPNVPALQTMRFMNQLELRSYLAEIRRYPAYVRTAKTIRNVRWLHTMCINGNNEVNHGILSMCMENTFKLRQYEVKKRVLAVHVLIQHFPGLTDYDQFRQEFQRVTGKNVYDFEHRVETNIYFDKRNHPRYENLQGEMLLKFYTDRISATESADQMVKYYYYIEDEDFLIRSLRREQPAIFVLESVSGNNCTVSCVRNKVVSGLTFHNAFLAAFYCYHIFDTHYATADGNLWDMLVETLGETRVA